MIRSYDRKGRYRFLRGLGHVLRLLLLISSLTALGTAIVWIWYPQYIDQLDRDILAGYVAPYQMQLSQARESLLQKDERQGSALLETLLEDLEEIQNGDRLSAIKREAMAALAESYRRQSRDEDLLALGRRWHDFDSRDLNAEVWIGRSLMALPDRKQEGVRVLTALYEKAPGSKVVAKAYGEVLFQGGQTLEFFLNFKNQLQALRDRARSGWELYWDTGNGFKGSQKISVRAEWLEGLEMQLKASLPPGSFRQLRVDCPAWLDLYLVAPGFRLPGESGSEMLRFVDTAHGLHDMTRQDGSFFASGSDPFAEVRLPQNLVVDSSWELVFQAKLFPGSLSKVLELLQDRQKRETLQAQLEGKADRQALSLFMEVVKLLGIAS